MITSTRNPKIQWIRSLQASPRKRRDERAFVIEGVRLLEEAASAGIVPVLVLHTSDLTDRGVQLVEHFTAGSTEILSAVPHAFKSASETKTPQGILAVCPLPGPAAAVPRDPSIILDHLSDPGNLGTILRTAAALGVKQALLSPGCADPFAPKVLRGGMGAQFHLEIQMLAWEEIGDLLAVGSGDEQIQVLLAAAGEGLPFDTIDLQRPTALIIGGEAAGASAAARALAHQPVHIPMPGGSESLNAAVAAGILLYEIARQRS